MSNELDNLFDKIPTDPAKVLDADTAKALLRTKIFSIEYLTNIISRVTGNVPEYLRAPNH